MKWTGADILVQLEGGWEIDEIASATGLGIAEVRRLVRDERYRMRQQIKEEEVADKRTEAEEKETTEEVDIHAWTTISLLAGQPEAPAIATIATRAESEDPKWAHYESIPVEEVEGNWHPRTTALYRLREGTGWEALEVECSQEKVDTPERHDLGLIVEDWERIKELLYDGGYPAAGSCLAPLVEKLFEHSIELQEVRRLEADDPELEPTEDDETPLIQRLEDLVDLKFEIANLYAMRATDDFAELEQRCWDLKQAKKHYRRREVLMQEWCEEEGR